MAPMDRGVLAHPGHFYDLADGEHRVLSAIVEPRQFADGCHRLGLLVDGV